MRVNEPSADRAKVVAAAHAAASWARARRATWTDAPLPLPERRPEVFEPIVPLEASILDSPIVVEDEEAAVVEPAHIEPDPLPEPAGPSMFSASMDATRSAASQAVAWVPRIAAAAAVVVGVAFGARYAWRALTALKPAPAARTSDAEPQPAAKPSTAAPARGTGGLHIVSTPSGAEVIVDRKSRGSTPLTVDALPAGAHTVELRSSVGSVQRSVTIAAGRTAEMDEAIFSGWLTVYAPFEIAIAENGRALTLDDRNQLMLPPGHHDLRVSNRALAYDQVHRVDLKPGEMATLRLEAPMSSVSIATNEPADAWLDGTSVGQTPLANVPIAVGTHELLLKRANGAVRRQSIQVTTRPFSATIDLSQDREED